MINNEINNVDAAGGGGEKKPKKQPEIQSELNPKMQPEMQSELNPKKQLEQKPEKRRRRFGERPVGARIGIVAAWIVGGVLLLAVALLCSLTYSMLISK